MGYSNWSDSAYHDRQQDRRDNHRSAFSYDDQVRSTGQTRVHPDMNPYCKLRESRDSAAHPRSLAIGVIFDVTGSMGTVPRVLQTKLGALMRVMTEKARIADPQLLFGAVGDAYCDRVPLQIGQFESGLEMDDDLGKLYLEGGGGGQVHETYELALYFMARHTIIDCYEQRGKPGYLFTIGDEKPYSVVRHQQVQQLIGDPIEADIPTAQIVAEVQRRYNYFHIIPTNTAHGQDTEVQETWRMLLGERVLLLANEEAVCETIALAIGLSEGTFDDLRAGADDLAGAGYDRRAAKQAAAALSGYAAGRGPRRLPAPSDDDQLSLR